MPSNSNWAVLRLDFLQYLRLHFRLLQETHARQFLRLILEFADYVISDLRHLLFLRHLKGGRRAGSGKLRAGVCGRGGLQAEPCRQL